MALSSNTNFKADDNEIVKYQTGWKDFWKDDNQAEFAKRIDDFSKLVESHKTAGQVLKTAGRWRRRLNSPRLNIALLFPRADNPEWHDLHEQLQQNTEFDWTFLSPSNIQIETGLLKEVFDVLVVDVGPRGTPLEALGYIQATGVPQIRLCRVRDEAEVRVLGRFLSTEPQHRPRSVYQQDPPDEPAATSIPRLLDGFKLDAEMRPVIFWTTVTEAAKQILDTTNRILTFRSGAPREEGGIVEPIDTFKSAKKYFDQYWQRAGRGSVFISFAGNGGASNLADRLAKILRFQYLRCFQYRDPDSGSEGRLESGEDVDGGLTLRLEQADIVVYLIEESFLASEYCQRELAQGRELRNQGHIELRAYSLEKLEEHPPELKGISIRNFPAAKNWTDPQIEEQVVADVEASADVLGWALRKRDRETLAAWLKEDQRDSVEEVSALLGRMGNDALKNEIKSYATAATVDAWLDTVLKLPKGGGRQRRARQIVALLLLAVTYANSERLKIATSWLHERRLLQWPALKGSEEEYVPIEGTFVFEYAFIKAKHDLTIEEMRAIGQKLAKQYGDTLKSSGPLCVTARIDFLAVPIEWVCESQDDEPLAVRRPVRWHLREIRGRACVSDSIAKKAIPPNALVLALASRNINPQEQMRRLKLVLRSRYQALGWPPEFVGEFECRSVNDVLSRLRGCQEQVVHITGHMGAAGLQVGGELLQAIDLASAFRASDVRLVVLNGCEGGKSKSPVASAYLTLADRLIRDADIPEIVAHRCKISESDALAFAEAFYTAFFRSDDGFDPAKSAMEGRKAGPSRLRYSPVVLSQREPSGSSALRVAP